MLLASTLALVLLLVGAGYGYLQFRAGQISKVSVPGLRDKPPHAPYNVLVVGSDTRTGLADKAWGKEKVGGQRNDVTMILHVDPGANSVTALSIPRDTVVTLAGTNKQNRINEALTGGASQLVQTITNSFGIPLDHYVLLNFDGFQAVVNALGGINMEFPFPARDVNSGLDIKKAGCQHLDGEQALALARSRYFEYYQNGRWRDDPLSDLGRIKRQGVFLRAVIGTAQAKGLTNPLTANAFLGAIVKQVTIDDKLTVPDMVGLARELRGVDPAALNTLTLPTKPAPPNYRGLGDVQLPDTAAVKSVVAEFLGEKPAAAGGPSGSPAPVTKGSPAGSAPKAGTAAPAAPAPPAAAAAGADRPFDPRPC